MNDRVDQIREQYDKQLSELICRKVNQHDCCHDILQEVYLRIIQHLDKIDKADKILPYIKRLASNAVIDHYRAQNKKSTAWQLENVVSTTEKEGVNRTHALASSFFMEMIETLPSIYKDALVKTELEGISQKQLAIDLGISYSGLKSRVQRAKEILRQSILDCCDYKFDRYGNVISCCGDNCC
jgi:RNA polymerase sigma-70 factor (ECF subfamily)